MIPPRLPLPTVPPSQPAAPARDVTAAQRAFFQAALGKAADAPAPVQPVPPAPAPAAQMVAAASPQPDPDRPLRPGSFIDIRV